MKPLHSLSWHKIVLNLRNPFRLSYGVSETRHAFWLRLPHDDGWGEGTIPPYYGVAEAEMEQYWHEKAEQMGQLPESLDEIGPFVGAEGPAPARCALDLALHDRLGKQLGLPLYQLLGLPTPAVIPSSFTIAIDTPESMAKLALDIPQAKVLKIKLGSDDDTARIRAVREARPDVSLRVDANAGWTVENAVEHIRALEPYNIELIEQPLPKEQIDQMGDLQKATEIPIVADESVQTMSDIERLAATGVRGVNLKLMKMGGLVPGVAMLRRARELGLLIMLGCMIETSLGTTAMAHLTGLAQWVDLDAPLLISNDPFDGLTYSQNLGVQVPNRVGIGATYKTHQPLEEEA